MKDINRIIKSEVVARQPGHRFKQAYGEVGNSANITSKGVTTFFTTEFVIKKVIYVTVNGVNLIEGKHYEVTGDNVISISNYRSAIKKLPGLTTNILVGYYFGRPINTSMSFDIAPEILDFHLSPTSGFGNTIVFNFEIAKNDGRNLYWSILKDGSDNPLFSGESLRTTGGTVVDSVGNVISLQYYLSDAEARRRTGDEIPFTLVLVYDLTDDGTHKDEKCLKTAVYEVLEVGTTSGEIYTTPTFINAAGSYTVDTTINIFPAINTVPVYAWRIMRVETIGGIVGVEQLVMVGNESSPTSDVFSEVVAADMGDKGSIKYTLEIDEAGNGFVAVKTSMVRLDVPAAALLGKAGFVDANVMFSSGAPIASLAEYNTLITDPMYTLQINKGVINNNDRVNPSVNTFNGTVDAVFPMFEIPNNWGAIRFNNGVGDIDKSAFSEIDLQNGLTAYIYKLAPSSVNNPTRFFIKQ